MKSSLYYVIKGELTHIVPNRKQCYVSNHEKLATLLDCRPDGHTLLPLGNLADIPYLKEHSFLHRIRDVCTL